MFRVALTIIPIFLILSGCGTKRQYFEPDQTVGKVKYEKKLPAPIIDVFRHGATLENGQVIVGDGVLDIVLPKDFVFLGQYDDNYVAASRCGELIILNGNSEIIYSKKFDKGVAAAALDGTLLALIDRSNGLYLIDTKDEKRLFYSKQEDVFALDARISNPYFLNTLVIYPTLDGKVIIVDRNSGETIRDVVISSEQFFNNVIFLNVIGDRLVVATSTRAISINPNNTAFLDADIKDLIVLEDRVFIFTKDGRVLLTDTDLNILKERKFEFAVFSGVIHGEFIYMVEKNGFLIATDLDLKSVNIYKLPNKIKTMVFATDDTLFVGDRYLKLNKN